MITVYLNLPGNTEEAIAFYTRVFKAPAPYIMRLNEMPQDDQAFFPEETRHQIAYANIKTFAGDLMLSDSFPNDPATPTNAVYICLSHKDHDLIKSTFEALQEEGGQVEMPLEATFFNPLYGIVVDKFGFRWMMMAQEE